MAHCRLRTGKRIPSRAGILGRTVMCSRRLRLSWYRSSAVKRCPIETPLNLYRLDSEHWVNGCCEVVCSGVVETTGRAVMAGEGGEPQNHAGDACELAGWSDSGRASRPIEKRLLVGMVD